MKRIDRASAAASPKHRLVRRFGVGVIWALVALSAGCSREFFRNWADQDVAEAVFEKSRDPRWQLAAYSIEPPALSRYADPFDPDRPPAPPDDRATEALSPAPQWPNFRLLTPAEGTGYLDMLETWRRQRPAAGTTSPTSNVAPGDAVQPRPMPPPAPRTPAPFQMPANSGTNPTGMSPTSVPGNATPPPSPDSRPAGAPATPPQARLQPPARDPRVQLATFQAPDVRPQVPPPDRPVAPVTPPERPVPGANLPPERFREGGLVEAGPPGLLNPAEVQFDEAEAAGLPPGFKPYIINPAQAVALALINNRAYQYHLESIYLLALNVTLQRFQLAPQYFAGQPPLGASPFAGGLASNPTTSFFYKTKETGSPSSTLSLGEVAGFGKVASFGTRIVGGYANQVLFNFLGHPAGQPVSVTSFLPLTITQAFLRGGGRPVTLEPLTGAERTLVYEVRNFARYRQEFIPSIIGVTQPVDNPGIADPNVGYLFVLQQLQDIENDRITLAAYQEFFRKFSASLGGGSGISQLQVDQVEQSLQNQAITLINDTFQYRNVLDQYKYQLGMPTDVPLVLDRSPLDPIRRVFFEIDAWSKKDDKDRDNADLQVFVERLPQLKDVVIDGRPVVASYSNPNLREQVNLAGERLALENRLDLMNIRAQLYDAWRGIAVAANGLLGTFTVSITNQFPTPPTTTNPFGFLDSARQFSLVLNTDLPLIRVNDRNLYRTALITYRRQQRALMAFEDQLKYTIRNDIRQLVVYAETYELQRRLLLLNLRQKDNAQRQINAPPAGAGVDTSALVNSNTNNLLNAQARILTSQNALIGLWVNYETQRMEVIRDLGTMPYDEWEAFYEFFPPEPAKAGGVAGADAGPAAGRPTRIASAAAGPRP